MNAWRSQVEQQAKAMEEVPLASTYLAARWLAGTVEGEALRAPLLHHLRSVLATCPNRPNAALGMLVAGRQAALPLDRDDFDCLFAAAAAVGGGAGNRIFCSADAPVGLGHFDIGRSYYVSTLADCFPQDLQKKQPFLPVGAYERLQPALGAAQESFCGLRVHDDSPSLFAVEFGERWLAALQPGLEATALPDGLPLQCRVYVRSGKAASTAFKLHSEKPLRLQRLPSGALALTKARPEWLLEIHALSMQEAWVQLECPAFRLLCRLPDISAAAQVPALGFLPQEWFARELGIPDTCHAYLPPALAATLTSRFPWFAPTTPLTWLERASPSAPSAIV